MTHASEIIEIISRNGYTYVEVPVTIDYTEYSTQKAQPVLNAVNIAVRHAAPQGEQPMILVQLLHRRRVRPSRSSDCAADATYGVNAWKKLAVLRCHGGRRRRRALAGRCSPRSPTCVGVGRGTDLVLYIVSVAFGFYVVNQYLRGQDAREELHRLARRIAVVEAADRYGLAGVVPAPRERSEQPADEPGDGTTSA